MIKFSIIIPTADRHYLLQHTLRSCLATDRDDIEVVVSDNFSSPETKLVVDGYRQDERLRYFRTDRRMPMPEHWDFAWSKARGHFIIINCDDDLVSPSGLNIIDRAIETFDPRIVSWHIGLYFHPDYDSEGAPNTLLFPAGHSNLHMLLDSYRIIAAYAKFNFRYFPEGNHFCIAKELGDHVINTTGRLFWAPSPDFSAPLLALATAENARYCYVDSILGFGGRSKHSNAASFVRGVGSENSKRIEEFHSEFGDEEDIFPHHPLRIPFYYNNHFASISLLKKFYPKFADVDIDTFKFFYYAYEELFRIRYNPMVDISMEKTLDNYIAGLEPSQREAAARARREVLLQRNWRIPRNHMEFIRTITPRFVKEGIKRLMVELGVDMRATQITISGAKHGFSNSFELCANWDRIVQENDRFSLANINEAFRKDFVLSVHKLSSA